MELKPLKNGEVAITVTYHITDELVNEKLWFIRNESKVRGDYDGISAIYIDDGNRKKPTSTITFSEPGEHIVRIVLEDSTVVPYGLLWGATEIYSIEFPDTVTVIEWAAINTTMAMPPVLPPHLKTINDNAFGSAFGGAFKDVPILQLPDSVETVDRENFSGVKHLVVGKNFQGNVTELCVNEIEKITIPDDNKYLEVKDGFVIDRASKKLLGILPGTFEDSIDTTIRFPEGISSIASDIIKKFEKVSVSIPGSVENCKLYLGNEYGDNTTIHTVNCAEGVKELIIYCDGKVKFSLPDTVTKLELYRGMTPIDLQIPKSVSEMALNVTMEELHIPSGVKLRDMTGNVNRLYLGQDITLEGTYPYHLFDDFKGEVFVKGTVHFDEWGTMKDDCVIHVQDEEIGRKIFNSKDFNKKVKIYIGDNKPLSEQEEGAQDKRIFNLLGVPEFPYHLQQISQCSSMVTALFNFQEKTSVEIEAEPYLTKLYYTLDDKPEKKLNTSKRAVSIVIPQGIHIVRFIGIGDMTGYDDGPAFEPACEVMLIDDNYSLDGIAKNMKGVKHLILGAGCHLKYVDSLADLPYPQISVVPENQWLEYRDGCIFERETQKLILINSEVNNIPDGISEIGRGALSRYNNERLVIPCFSKVVCLIRARREDGVDNLKELVFEEGIEEIDLRNYSFSQDVAITFPKTLNKLKMYNVKAKRITVPFACKLESLGESAIENLEFLGDVALRPRDGSESYDMFYNFSGNILFHGAIDLFQMLKSDEDKPSSFIGKMKDDCTITVANQETADAIKHCKDFNPKVKIIVE